MVIILFIFTIYFLTFYTVEIDKEITKNYLDLIHQNEKSKLF